MISSGPNLFAMVGSILLLLIILELVRRKYLRERYSLIWIATGVVFSLLAIRADLLNKISYWLGFTIPSNALFFFGILFLLFIVLGLSVITSRLAEKNKILTQEVVLLRKRVCDLENSQNTREDKTPENI
jgi:uncharacterized membrane protein